MDVTPLEKDVWAASTEVKKAKGKRTGYFCSLCLPPGPVWRDLQ